jgi:hypothetical protein
MATFELPFVIDAKPLQELAEQVSRETSAVAALDRISAQLDLLIQLSQRQVSALEILQRQRQR